MVNPIAGHRDKKDIINVIKKKSIEDDFKLFIYRTSGKNDKVEITNLIREHTISRVLVAGGDGTIKLVAETLEKTDIILGILPAGSANGLAVNFKIPEDQNLQAAIALGNCTISMDILELNGQVCLHIADMGINAELIQNYENSSFRGKLGYFLQSIPTIFQSESPFNFKIEAHGKVYEKTGILLAIANANTFGTGANINPKGKIDDGKFEILVFKNLDFIEIFKTMKEDAKPSKDFVDIISVTEAIISASKKVAFQIDGEYEGKINKVTAKLKPFKLAVAVPLQFCDLQKQKDSNDTT